MSDQKSVMIVVGMSPWGEINDRLSLCQVCDGIGKQLPRDRR